MKTTSKDYRDYIIKDGIFIGAFEEMYQNIQDPWFIGNANHFTYNVALELINYYKICENGGYVLDVGCGKGSFTSRLKKQMSKSKIIGIDISETAINKSKNKYKDIEFKCLNILNEYDKLSVKFNLIVMSQIMWYILPQFDKIIKILWEKLNDDGYLLIMQSFLKQEEQKYGKEIIKNIDDMLQIINHESIEMIELNRFKEHDSIILFKRWL